MKKPALIMESTSLAQWYDLVCQAEGESAIRLHADLESYLVFLLMRFMDHPEWIKSILAMEFLQGIQWSDRSKDILQSVGDKCLLFAGLFAEQTEKRRVQRSYFVYLGQSAYETLAGHTYRVNADLYYALSDRFVALMDVLQTIRAMREPEFLKPLQAAELWHETGSTYALKNLQKDLQRFVLMNQFKSSTKPH